MILKSRQQTKWTDRVKNFFWPKKSYWRSLQYFGKRILRIHATPHALALGFAIGVFAAFTPPGIHVPLAVLIAWVVDANMISAALATAISNPFTFIPIGALDLKVGDWFFGHHTGPHAAEIQVHHHRHHVFQRGLRASVVSKKPVAHL